MDEPIYTGSYILRSLVQDVALSADGDSQPVRITCVEIWADNLYIGTSRGEILHHVRLPSDDPNDAPVFILASRQQPPVIQSGDAGIQQILLMPAVGKACVISNSTLSFYTLPELSPAFPSLNPLKCDWVGGVDLDSDDDNASNGIVIMMCLRNRIRLVKIADQALKLRDIEFGGCLATVRRGDFACVADSRSYALLDVVHQQKIPLFTISSIDNQPVENAGILSDDAHSIGPGSLSRNLSPADPLRHTLQEERGHRKTSSLNLFRRDNDPNTQEGLRPGSGQRYGFDTPAERRSSARRVSTTDIQSALASKRDLSKPLPPPPQTPSPDSRTASPAPPRIITPLKPLIASPSPQLFLLVTGTSPEEPSVGMFVNLDGDVARGTIEFSNYPDAIVADGKGYDLSSSMAPDGFGEEGYILAVVDRKSAAGTRQDVEIQRWDVEAGEANAKKEWLNVHQTWLNKTAGEDGSIGLRSLNTAIRLNMPEIASKLAMKPIKVPIHRVEDPISNLQREKEEADFVQRLCSIESHIALWYKRDVFWLMRNPLLMKLDARLKLAQATSLDPNAPIAPQRALIEAIFNETRGVQSTTELDYFSLRYIRQKAALLLFIDLVIRTIASRFTSRNDRDFTEQALAESELDPRIILAFLPDIGEEITQADDGIWVQGGLKEIFDIFSAQSGMAQTLKADLKGPYGENLLSVVRRFLLFWRRKKGSPSVIDGPHIFETVDAAILHMLLLLDQFNPPGSALPGSLRAELYAIVDNGVDCYDRAVRLLEEFNRLYVLSRLYGRKKSAALVLFTWKRIIEGNEDVKGEFVDGEIEVRKYLRRLKDRNLVIEYGTWLANHNPDVGVQVFADESSKVVIPPAEALSILRKRAPNAVKHYLEYLVFGKKQSQHINELLAYYLDIVLHELKTSPASRTLLLESYETYRALQPPKPTYRQFITDNGIETEWWHSRLRLLHLLGSSQGPAASYDVLKILTKLEPFVDELVPEMIILNGRQGRHEEALRLLTQGLGDFDTAISYCLLGGSSIYRPPSGYVPEQELPSREEQSVLFNYLLHEFLAIQNTEDRIERVGELLQRFGPWFDAAYVLSLLPTDWSIDIFSTFLISALQRLIREKRETVIIKALSGAQNLQVSDQFIEKAIEVGQIVIEKSDMN